MNSQTGVLQTVVHAGSSFHLHLQDCKGLPHLCFWTQEGWWKARAGDCIVGMSKVSGKTTQSACWTCGRWQR